MGKALCVPLDHSPHVKCDRLLPMDFMDGACPK
jgi:hypothetical protein